MDGAQGDRVHRVEWFGQPDGAMGELDGPHSDFIAIPKHFGGVGRSPDDARVRVVAGPLGAGKSLLLRRMQDFQARTNSGATYAQPVFNMGSDLSTEDIAEFAERHHDGDANTETWKLLWRRAIIRSAVSLIRNVPTLREACDESLLNELASFPSILGSPRTPRSIPSEANRIVRMGLGRRQMRGYLGADEWSDIENYLERALRQIPPLFMYIDDIDKNYRWAPIFWAQCQRGLFYTLMDPFKG